MVRMWGWLSSVRPCGFLLLVLLATNVHAVIGSPGTLCDIPKDKFIQDIPENWKVGTVIRHLQIVGDDSEISVWETSKTDPHVRFDPASRNLTLVQPLDRDKGTAYISFEVGCTILSTRQQLKTEIKIVIVDVNDNAPRFKQDHYTANISELSPIGMTVVREITATDADADKWYIEYEIVEGTFSSYFSVPLSSQGTVVLNRTLDYDSIKEMTIQLMAKDNPSAVLGVDQPQLNSTTTITVYVFDGDNRNPAFINGPYTATIVETTPLGSTLPITPSGIRAIDQDRDINAPVVYNIVPDTINGDSDYFSIDSRSGVVILQKGGIQKGTRFSLLIQATQTDNKDRYVTTLLSVWVTAANENPPRFSKPHYVISVVENLPVRSPVLTVTATDNDMEDFQWAEVELGQKGTVLTYYFRSSVNDFTLDQRGGLITTARVLDFELRSQYNFTIEVSDGQFTDMATVTVNVIDVNDNVPTFPQNIYSFSPKREKGLMVGKVQAVDRDPGSKVSYYFKSNVTLFSINNKGEITIVAPAEDLVYSQYELFVIASDDGFPALEGSAVAQIQFSGGLGAVSGAVVDAQVDMTVIIILGVLSGCLLVVIIILLVYMYRNSKRATRQPDFVRSKSFENRLNLHGNDNRTYLEDPQGITYKPRQARHLAIYNDIPLDSDDSHSSEGQTAPQDNPFAPDDNYTSYNSNTTYTTPASNQTSYATSINKSGHASNGSVANSNSINNGNQSMAMRRAMSGVNEIEFDSAVAPMDNMIQSSSSVENDDSLPNSSVPDSIGGSSVITFRAGDSTQQLVTPKGTIGKGSVKKRGAVSFIDSSEIQMYNPQNTHVIRPQAPLDPNVLVAPLHEERPGITVYY